MAGSDKVKQTSLHEEHIEEKKKEVAELQDTIKEYENRVQQLNGEIVGILWFKAVYEVSRMWNLILEKYDIMNSWKFWHY